MNDNTLDQILTELENAVQHDVMRRVANRQPGTNTKVLHAKAKQQLTQMVKEIINVEKDVPRNELITEMYKRARKYGLEIEDE